MPQNLLPQRCRTKGTKGFNGTGSTGTTTRRSGSTTTRGNGPTATRDQEKCGQREQSASNSNIGGHSFGFSQVSGAETTSSATTSRPPVAPDSDGTTGSASGTA